MNHLFCRRTHQNKQYFVFGKRKSGLLDIRNLDGKKVNNGSISYKKLKRIKHNSTKLTERRRQFPYTSKGHVVSLPKIL